MVLITLGKYLPTFFLYSEYSFTNFSKRNFSSSLTLESNVIRFTTKRMKEMAVGIIKKLPKINKYTPTTMGFHIS